MLAGKGGSFAFVSRQASRNAVANQIVMPNDLWTDVLLKAAEQSKPMWRRMVENYFTNTRTAPIPDRAARARAHLIAAERLLMSRIEVAD
jgi:hypothetical protein